MNIISAESADHLRIVQEIAHQTWPSTFADILSKEQISYMLEAMYNSKTLKEQSASGSQNFLLIQDKDFFYGFASYVLNYAQSSSAKIHKLYLLPSAQGKGLGKLLIEHVENIAQSQKQKHVTLNVNKYNPAIGFYKKLGYQITKEEVLPIGPYWMDDYVMEKKLPENQ